MTEPLDRTVLFRASEGDQMDVKEIVQKVYRALEAKGYNPIDQLVGYLMSGDPAYITNFQEARSLIKKLERDELLEALLRNYLDK